MEKETTDKRIEKTKANILNALIALSKEKELNEISIRELTEAAHIHRNTFYLHYTDVDSKPCASWLRIWQNSLQTRNF